MSDYHLKERVELIEDFLDGLVSLLSDTLPPSYAEDLIKVQNLMENIREELK